MITSNGSPMSLHERCQYTNKQCPKRRTIKKNGQLHRFCEEHRERAKENQQRWLNSRVQQAKAKTKRTASTTSSPPPSSSTTPHESVPVTLGAVPSCPSSVDNDSLDELERLLFDEDEMNEFLDGLLLTHDELLDLQADVARACRVLKP